MEYRILGALEVWRDGRPVPLGRRSERALLALLAASANRVVPAEVLADDLWAGLPPPSAATALRVYVSRLRKTLEPDGDAVVTTGGGYLLRAEPGAVDAARFETLATRARDLAGSGDHSGASALFREALALWRGRALADVADAPLARAESARLEEARLAVLEDRLGADLACGRHRDAIGELEVLTGEHPLRERLWALRMLALYRDDRQAEALRAYQDLRRILGEQLGLDPAEPLRALEAAVLRHDPALDRAPAPAVAPGGNRPQLGLPLPGRLSQAPEVAFVGRASELDDLNDDYKAAVAGDGRRVVLMAGEPGVGKTALCSEFARRVHAAGGVVLYGRCEEELGIPYQPFAECLAHYVAHAPDVALAAHVAEYGSALSALVPALARRVSDLPPPRSTDSDTQRHMLFAATVGLLERAAQGTPVLCVLDDLHWADQPTLALLRYLVSASAELRLLVVGAYRHSELTRDRPLSDVLVALRRDRGVNRFDLEGLPDVDVVTLMESGSGRTLGPSGRELAITLHRETGGNPFFVLELMRHLTEAGLFGHDDGISPAGALAEGHMPESLREVVTQRVARLGSDAEQLLNFGAVVGRDFEVEVLAELTGRQPDDLVDVLDRATAAALLSEVAPGRYSFAHAVIQHTLYDSQGASRRALAHRRTAEALERLSGGDPGPRVAELARHWVAATPAAGADRALPYAQWAGEAASAGLAFEEAARWFSVALELQGTQAAPDHHLRCELLIGLGSAQRLAGDPAFRETLLDAARLAGEHGDSERMTRAALANSRGTFSSWGAVDTERVAVLQDAIAAGTGDSPERARLLATLAVELTFNNDWATRREIAGQALAMARRLSDPETIARVLNLTYFCVCVPETLDQRLADFRHLVTLPDALRDPAVRHWAYRNLLYSCADNGDVGQVDAHLAAVDEAATASGDPFLVWAAAFIRFWRTLLAGRLEEAEALAVEAHRRGSDSGFWEAGFIYLMELLDLRRQQDRTAELLEPFTEAAAATPIPFLRPLLGVIHCDAGHTDKAAALLAEDAGTGFAAFQYEFSWLYGMVHYAEVASRTGAREVAADLYERLLPWARQVAFFYWSTGGVVAFYLGLLATTLTRYDDADGHFAEAAGIHTGLGAPYWTARNDLEWARMLKARSAPGDDARAKLLLEGVATTGARFGFPGLGREAAALQSI